MAVKFRARVAKMGQNLIIIIPKALHMIVERGRIYVVTLEEVEDVEGEPTRA